MVEKLFRNFIARDATPKNSMEALSNVANAVMGNYQASRLTVLADRDHKHATKVMTKLMVSRA